MKNGKNKGNISIIIPFFNILFGLKYGEDRGEAQIAWISALSPISKILCTLNQKALVLFIGSFQFPMPLGLFIFYLRKINNY